MVAFTRLPLDNAPAGGALRYTFSSDARGTFLVRVIDSRNAELLAAMRFVDVMGATFDIAPVVRRAFAPRPATGATALCPATDRTAEISVAVYAEGSATPLLTAPVRTFLAVSPPLSYASILTSMPAERLLGAGECDELLLLPAVAQGVTITAEGRGMSVMRAFDLAATTPAILRIDSADFPGAERISVDAGACGTVGYTLLPMPSGSMRLAWRTSRGSVEHHTFPFVESREAEVDAGAARERIIVRSACVGEEAAEALSEIVSSPDVWIAERNSYTRVSVVSRRAAVSRRGVLSSIEIELSIPQKQKPWS